MKITQINVLWLLLVGGIVAISLILCTSLFIQFVVGEFPCPLCMVQRIAMMLCACGQVYILSRWACSPEGDLAWKRVAIGCAFTLLASTAGAAMSIRHILLHILPGDPGYGAPIMGLHLYTWGLVTFAAEVVAVSAMLLSAPRTFSSLTRMQTILSKTVIVCFIVVVAAFALGTFVEEGFNWMLPSDPTENLLFRTHTAP